MWAALVLGVFLVNAAMGEDCVAGNYEQQKASDEGQYMNCRHLASAYDISVDECKALTCDKGGNAFNYGNIGKSDKIGCYPKSCCNGYVYGNAPFNIYVYSDVDYGCAVAPETPPSSSSAPPLADAPALDVADDGGDDEDEGEVTPEGCKFRTRVHPAGEVWMESMSSGRNKECSCPDPLPTSWSAKEKCRGACQDGDVVHYGGDLYTKMKDGKEKNCKCNDYGKERCK